ncbi:MAG: Helix-turn-helix domain [Cyanobacteriota bacterium]|jgi:AraC-like DNA-binding protein
MVEFFNGELIDALQAKADVAAIRHTIHHRRFELLSPELICEELGLTRMRAEWILAELEGTCLQEEIWAVKAALLYTAIADDPGADLGFLLRRVGFDNIFKACSIFRHCYGMTPMRFRVNCQQAWRDCLAA